MNKLVTRINWVNDTDPAINDTHLNQMDSELDAIDDRVISMETDVITQAENAEAWANGTRGGEAIGPSDPAYHKDAKYQAGKAASSASAAATSATNAGNSATAAGNSATAAGNSALVSEGYAKGTQNGQPVGPTGPGSEYYENNAEYFKNQAQQIAAGTLDGLSDVKITSPTNGQIFKYDAATQMWVNANETVGIAPDNVSDIGVTVGDGTLTIKWSDPDDTVVEGQTICTWSKTKLVMKTGSYPSNEDDGTLVVTNSVRNQYATNGYVITGLVNDTTYYFQLFPISDGNAVNRNTANRDNGTPRAGVLTTITVNGGYEDVVVFKNSNDELLATCVFPTGEISGTCQINVPTGGLSCYVESTVYKTDSSTYFRKAVTLTDTATQTVDVYPTACWYWHGRKCAGNMTNISPYGAGTITYEASRIRFGNTVSTNTPIQGVFNDTKIITAGMTLHVETELGYYNYHNDRYYQLSTSPSSTSGFACITVPENDTTRNFFTTTITGISGQVATYFYALVDMLGTSAFGALYAAWAD